MQLVKDSIEFTREKMIKLQEIWYSLLTDGSVYWLIPLAGTAALLFYILWSRVSYLRSKARYSTRRKENNLAARIAEWTAHYEFIRLLAEHLAKKISIYTTFDFEKNYRISSALITAFALLAVGYGAVTIIGGIHVWYMALCYFLLISGFFILCFYIFSTTAIISFKKKLPRTLKILNSRYLSKGDILKALYTSLDDFDPAVRKEMKKIHDILQSNRMEEIDRTLRLMESTYNEEHFTLILNLIRHAYFKGEGQDEDGKEIIKAQFEKTTETILDDLENTKDLQLFSRSYILFALFLPVLFWGGKKFNELSLGGAASDYFKSQSGTQLELLFFFNTCTLYSVCSLSGKGLIRRRYRRMYNLKLTMYNYKNLYIDLDLGRE